MLLSAGPSEPPLLRRLPGGSIGSIGRLGWAGLSRAVAPRSRTPSGSQFSFPPPTPAAGLLPEAGRGVHPDVAAGRRAGFPLLSVRHDAALFLRHQLRRERAAAPQTPERAADTVMPSKTGGKLTICSPEFERGILTLYFHKKEKTFHIYLHCALTSHSEILIIRWTHLQLLDILKRKPVLQIGFKSSIIPTEIKMIRTLRT